MQIGLISGVEQSSRADKLKGWSIGHASGGPVAQGLWSLLLIMLDCGHLLSKRALSSSIRILEEKFCNVVNQLASGLHIKCMFCRIQLRGWG